MGDLNVTMEDKFMMDFSELNDLSSLIDKPTCYKNFDKPTCIISNIVMFLRLVSLIFPWLTVTQFKMGCQKLKPQVITAIIKILINVKFQVDIKTCVSDKNDINSFSFDDKKLA